MTLDLGPWTLVELTRCAFSLDALVTATNWATFCLWVAVEGNLELLIVAVSLNVCFVWLGVSSFDPSFER